MPSIDDWLVTDKLVNVASFDVMEPIKILFILPDVKLTLEIAKLAKSVGKLSEVSLPVIFDAFSVVILPPSGTDTFPICILELASLLFCIAPLAIFKRFDPSMDNISGL